MATPIHHAAQMATSAHIRLRTHGKADVESSTHVLGQGSWTALSQLAAEALGLPLQRVRLHGGDLPYSFPTASSSTTLSLGVAIQAAAGQLRRRLAALVDPATFDSADWRLAEGASVRGLVDAFAGGRIVNRGLAQLLEQSRLDLTQADEPELQALLLDEVDRRGHPLSIKGLGEIGVVSVAPAIANVMFQATGIRVRELPITLNKLLG